MNIERIRKAILKRHGIKNEDKWISKEKDYPLLKILLDLGILEKLEDIDMKLDFISSDIPSSVDTSIIELELASIEANTSLMTENNGK